MADFNQYEARNSQNFQRDLVLATNEYCFLQGQTNAALTNGIASALAPAALAKGESVSEAITRMVKGTPMETIIEKFCANK